MALYGVPLDNGRIAENIALTLRVESWVGIGKSAREVIIC